MMGAYVPITLTREGKKLRGIFTRSQKLFSHKKFNVGSTTKVFCEFPILYSI